MLLWFVIIDWIISVGIGLYAAPSKTEKIAIWGSVPGGALYFCFAFVSMFPAYSATLLAPSVTFSENILRSLFKSLSDHKQLRMMRIVTLTFTVVVTLYAMHAKASIFKRVENAYQITLVMAFIPLLCGIYWRRVTNQGALISIFFGLSAGLSILLFGPDDPFIPAQFAGLFASAFGMIAGSLMPQFVQHDPHIHDHSRHGHHAAEQTHPAEHLHHPT